MKKYNEFINEYLKNDAIGYNVGEFIYHVTTLKSLENIKDNGFIPQEGTSINGEHYKNRIYFATSLIAAYDIYENISSYKEYYSEYVIIKIDSKCLKDYEEDTLFNHGIYVDYNISKEYILEDTLADNFRGKFNDDDIENLYI